MGSKIFVTDATPSPRFPIYCRGNVGEVFPNVMTPMSASLFTGAAARGQARVVIQIGMVSPSHLAGDDAVLTGVFGGYLYGNVSLARVAAARVPGMAAADIDREMYGLMDAPPYQRQRGDRSLLGTLRAARKVGGALFRPEATAAPARDARSRIATWRAGLLPIEGRSQAELIELVGGLPAWFEEMMYHLLTVSGYSGMTRSILERTVAKLDEPGLVNVLTAGLGTIESAQPAQQLWNLGRLVAGSPILSAIFDAGRDGLAERLQAEPGAAPLRRGLDAFIAEHGARGPDEWELASPTWASDPGIALAAIDALRRAPDDRDPVAAERQLAAARTERIDSVRRRLRPGQRAIFLRSVRAYAVFAAEREATKAAFMRAVEPARSALVELARRAGVDHADLCLVTFDELPQLLTEPPAMAAVIAQRRDRRAYLQARVPPFWFEGQLPPPETWPLRSALDRPDPSTRTLTGMGVCPGVATGRARVVVDPADPRGLGPDDVLVAPITDPAWTPLFLAVSAVVVDVGAQQSHAAIVARELGIPAVVSVTRASHTIPDGTCLTVDGTNGTVTVHARQDN